MTETTAPVIKVSDGQTWLIGPNLYLRGLQESDAKWNLAWRSSPFPMTTKRAGETLEKVATASGKLRIIAFRVADDEPVGSAFLDFTTDKPSVTVELHTAPWVANEGQAEKAEMVRILTPWLIAERGLPAVSVGVNDREQEVIAALEALGYLQSYRWREARFVNGERRDFVSYELLNPVWTAILGDPGPGIVHAGEPVTNPRSPAPLVHKPSPHPLPPNAFIASERLALRAFANEDVEVHARSNMQETEYEHDSGRWPMSPLVIAKWIEEDGKDDPAEDLRIAIVLRETGALIGMVGLFSIDWINQTAETASKLFFAEHRGAGYGTEAKHLLLEYAFERLGIHLLWSWVHAYNGRSAAALRKQGYRDAGRAWWTDTARGEFGDGLVFDLLASEWRAARR